MRVSESGTPIASSVEITEVLTAADLDTVLAESGGQDIADALTGAASPDAGNVFATMADVGGGGSFSPDQLTGLQLWLDASDASTINAGSPADDDPVSSWADKSGNGYDATGTPTATIQTIDITGASMGQYEVHSTADVTAAIAWDADAAAVQAALESLSDVGPGNVIVTLLDQVYTATFDLSLTPVSLMTADIDTLDVSPTITMTQVGYGAINQPTYKTAIWNSLPILRFVASAPSYLGLSGVGLGLGKNASALSIAVVCNGINSGGQVIAALTNGGSPMRRFTFEVSDPETTSYRFGISNDDATDMDSCFAQFFPIATTSVTAPFMAVIGCADTRIPFVVINDAAGILSFQDGANVMTPGNIPNTNADSVQIGGDNTAPGPAVYDGDIAEIIVYDRLLDSKERRQVLEYLSSKWRTF